MKNLLFCWGYLLCLTSCANINAEQTLFWSKMEIIAELPAPYDETAIAFLTSEQDDSIIVSQIEMHSSAGQWVYTHPDLAQIPVEILSSYSAIPLNKNCAEFQNSCIPFLWLVGEPQYISFPIGGKSEFYKHIYLKVSDDGRFDFKIVDTYQEGLKHQQAMIELLKELEKEKQQPESKVNHDIESIAFPFPAISLSKAYYGSRVFYYELPALLGSLSIRNTIVDALPVDYLLTLPSGDSVDVARTIKASGLRFSGLSNPLVSLDNEDDALTLVIPCLLSNPEDETRYTAARFTIERNGVISTSFVKQDIQYRVCELKD